MDAAAAVCFLCYALSSATVLGQEFQDEYSVEDLTLSKTDYENEVILTWNSTNKVDFYTVYIETPKNYPNLQKKTTYTAKIKINSLSPGLEYKFGVSATRNSSESEVQYISFKNEGVELPKVTGLTLQYVHDSKVGITWDKIENDTITYGIYVSENINDVVNGLIVKTEKNRAEIYSLRSCKNYFFNVGIVGCHTGPLSDNILNVTTSTDALAKPVNLTVEMDNENYGKMIVKWNSSCENVVEPIGYFVILRDHQQNSLTFQEIPKSTNTTFQIKFRISYGNSYDIKVSTSELGAIPARIHNFLTPQVLEPYNLSINCTENSIFLNWKEPLVPKNMLNYIYEILMKDDNYLMRVSVKKPPFIFKLANIKSNYTYSVLLKSSDGKVSSRESKIILCS